MIKYTFEFLECSLPRPAVTKLYHYRDPAKDDSYEPLEWTGEIQRESDYPYGTATVRVTAHIGNVTTSQDVQVVVKREFVEQMTKIMQSAVKGLENYHRVEGWPTIWEKKDDPR